MLTQTIFKRAFWILALTGVMNWFSVKLYLYWTVWWIDMVVHFLGGLTVGLAFMWLCSYNNNFKNWSPKKLLFFALLGTIAVGIIWEIYELYFGLTSLSDGIAYFTDTGSDLIMDFIGGILSFLYVNRLIKKYK